MASVEWARSADRERALDLLRKAELPVEGVAEHLEDYLVARDDGHLVGLCGLEVYGPHGLLRSAVVDPGVRKQGLGRLLVEAALEHARELELDSVYLLTTTARDYFSRLGFEDAPREEAPEGIRGCWEFRSGCPQGSAFMRLRLQ